MKSASWRTSAEASPGAWTCTVTSAIESIAGSGRATGARPSAPSGPCVVAMGARRRIRRLVEVREGHEGPEDEVVPLGDAAAAREEHRGAGGRERAGERGPHVDRAVAEGAQRVVPRAEALAHALALRRQLGPLVVRVDLDARQAARLHEELHEAWEL